MITLTSKITVQLIDKMGSDESLARAAWVCPEYREDFASLKSMRSIDFDRKINQDEITRVINFLMKHRHGTPFEHSAITVFVHAPIFVFREWHRHRIGQSYNEQSARYQPLAPVFWIPERDRRMCETVDWKPGKPKFETLDEYVKRLNPITLVGEREAIADRMYEREYRRDQDVYELAYSNYLESIREGISMEVARCKLPVGIYSAMYCTMNPRSIMSFLSLRTGRDDAFFRSYPMREIEIAAELVEEILTSYWPVTANAFVKNGRVAP